MKRHNNPTQAVLEKYHYGCQYCGGPGDGVDHIIPYSYLNGHGGENNLVGACQSCNSIAGDRIFESFQEKRAYILTRRSQLKKDKPKNICPDCGHYFRKKLSSVLCNRCYRKSERDLSKLFEEFKPVKPARKSTKSYPAVYNPAPRAKFKDGPSPVSELALSFAPICEMEFQAIYEIVVNTAHYLEMGQETHHYRNQAGQLLTTLDEVVSAILKGELAA